jgi:hypothetical protein
MFFFHLIHAGAPQKDLQPSAGPVSENNLAEMKFFG